MISTQEKIIKSCLGIVILLTSFLFLGYGILTHTIAGYDFVIIPGSIAAFKQGLNFYLVENLQKFSGVNLSNPYLFFWTKIMAICAYFGRNYYPLFYFGMFLATYCVIPKKSNIDIDAGLLLFGCFSGFFWVLNQGNIEVIALLFFGIAYRYLYFEKWKTGSLHMGIAASVKLLPIVLCLPLLWRIKIAKKNTREVIKNAICFISGFLIPHIISFLMSPKLYPYYWLQALGLLGNQHSPISEINSGGNGGTSFFKFTNMIVEKFGGHLNPILFLAFWVIIGGCFFIFIYRKFKTKIKINFNNSEILWLSIIWCFLIMPRLKVYTFCNLIIPVYFLTKDLVWKFKKNILLVSISIPATGLLLLKFGTTPNLHILGARCQFISAGITTTYLTYLYFQKYKLPTL